MLATARGPTRRVSANTTADASHVSMVSQPTVTIEAILAAAASIS
jgi:hypothetical protein